MLGMKPIILFACVACCLASVANEPYTPSREEVARAYQRASEITRARNTVLNSTLTPNWIGGGSAFWYKKQLSGGRHEYVRVNSETGGKSPLFDHAKMAESLTKAFSTNIDATRLPLDEMRVATDEKTLTVTRESQNWLVNLETYECTRTSSESQGQQQQGGRSGHSPDGKLRYELRDGKIQVFEIGATTPKFETTLADYASASWAPNSRHIAAFRVIPGDRKQVFLITSSPQSGGRATFVARDYDLPGDKLDTYETIVIDAQSGSETKSDLEPFWTGGRPWASPPRAQWRGSENRFLLQFTERGYQAVRIVAVDLESAKATTLIDERSSTFVDTTALIRRDLTRTNETIWRSERDGFGRLYLHDLQTGALKNVITPAGWVVRSIENIDEGSRTITFSANNTRQDQDPYFIHFFHVDFDGKNLVRLTDSNGQHRVNFSPNRKRIVTTWSRVDSPPVHELRDAETGKLISIVDEADTTAWAGFGIRLPEVFVAKGRDGATDIWGIVCRPRDFDPEKKYPIIENIYAGPHDSFVPKTFSPVMRMQELAELGFIVVQIDGMGTRNRGKKFHDICWQNIADAGFPDRILWMKALAEKYSYIDIERVGLYGTSAGGQNAAGALLFHPEFYKVAVSSCGCHDNRMDKFWWNEQWMGYPVGKHYEEQSNITNASKLRGKLLLIVGEVDTNVPPESTIRFVDALVKANRDFDFLLIPNAGHTDGGAYGESRRRDYFVRHLHGAEPPDRNANPTRG